MVQSVTGHKQLRTRQIINSRSSRKGKSWLIDSELFCLTTPRATLPSCTASVCKFGDTWYAYGENKVNGNLFQGVCCYTTTDFIAWRSHGIVLDVQEDGSALAADRIGERPKVLHCPATGKYVMYIHAETPDYGYAHIGVAVADAPTYRSHSRPPSRGAAT